MMRDTLQVRPCKLFVDILSPKVSHHATRLPRALSTTPPRHQVNIPPALPRRKSEC